MNAHPEWAAVGKTVSIVSETMRGPMIVRTTREATVARHTPTSIILDNDLHFRRTRKSQSYYRTPYIGATYLAPLKETP